jgi:hypothetical protein
MMQKWEYLVQNTVALPTATPFVEHLNRLGDDGWELVSLRFAPDPHFAARYYDLVFKRPKGGEQ